MPQAVDYAALADQARKTAAPPVDYAALAEQARRGSDFSTTNEKDAAGEAVVAGPVSRFGSGLARTLLPSTTLNDYNFLDTKGGAGYALAHPMDSLHLLAGALGESHKAEALKTVASLRGMVSAPDMAGAVASGSEALGHGAATLIPFIGPAAARAGETIASGDVAGGLGEAAGLLAPFGASKAAGAGGRLRQMMADRLSTSAERSYGQALNPTRIATKATAARIIPEALRRRIVAKDLPSLEARAARESTTAGQAVDAALQPHQHVTAPTIDLVDQLEKAKAPYIGTDTKGQPVVNVPERVQAIQNLQDTLMNYGDQVSVQSMRKLRQNWDEIVDAARGFAVADLGTKVKAWAAREGRSALRTELSKAVPALDRVNSEYAFWQNLEDVAAATNDRRVGQNGSLLSTIAAGAGAVVADGVLPGAGVAAKSIEALAGAKMAAGLKRLIDSPGYKMWSAVQKQRLADALASRNRGAIQQLVIRGLIATSKRVVTAMEGSPKVVLRPTLADRQPDATDRARK